MNIDSLADRLKRLSMNRGRPGSSYAANNKKRDRETYENEIKNPTITKSKNKIQKTAKGKRKKLTKKRKHKKRKSTRKK